jgi:nitrogen fixation NifU-like protein
MAGDDELYQDRILEHFEQPFHRGSCPRATHAHEDDNPLCGDSVRLELSVDAEGNVRDAFFTGEGCCVSQASASMLVEAIVGKSVADLQSMSANDMLTLFGPRLTSNRQKCCLLSWRVLQQAIWSPVRAQS